MPVPRGASGLLLAPSIDLMHVQNRSVAQPGSALYWGCRGRGFKSRRSDHFSLRNSFLYLLYFPLR